MILAPVWMVLLHHEVPSFRTMIGGGIVLVALFTYLIYNNMMTISQAWVASGKVSFVVGVLSIHLFMLCLLPLLFYRRIAILSLARFSR